MAYINYKNEVSENHMTKLVILGRKSQTGNYETFFRNFPPEP